MYKNLITFPSHDTPRQYTGMSHPNLSGRFHFEEPHYIIQALTTDESLTNDFNFSSNLNSVYWTLATMSDPKKSQPLRDLKNMYNEHATRELIEAINGADILRATKKGQKDFDSNGIMNDSERLTFKLITIIQKEKKRLGKDINRLKKLGLLENAYKFH